MFDAPGFAPRFEYSDSVRGADGVGGVVLGMSRCIRVTRVVYACFLLPCSLTVVMEEIRACRMRYFP